MTVKIEKVDNGYIVTTDNPGIHPYHAEVKVYKTLESVIEALCSFFQENLP